MFHLGFHGNATVLGGQNLGAVTFGYGKRKFHRLYLIAVFAGPSRVTGTLNDPNEYLDKKVKTIGLNACCQLIFKPLTEIGFGIDLFANINPEQNFYGGRLAIHFGNGK